MIETERLTLRPMTEEDRGWFRAQAASPEVMEHLGGPQLAEVADARVDYMIKLQAERGFSFWLLRRTADGERIGICGLKLFDAPNATMPGEIEIGWRLEPFAWGRGYAREAASASLDFAFARLAAPRVVALTNDANVASWGLMERLGMTRRRDLDFLDPRYPDSSTIVYLIEASQWKA